MTDSKRYRMILDFDVAATNRPTYTHGRADRAAEIATNALRRARYVTSAHLADLHLGQGAQVPDPSPPE